MRRMIISVVATGLISTLQAQEQRGAIGFSAGYGLPLGQFGNLDIKDEDAGYAKRGSFYEFSLTHGIGEDRFGFAALVRSQRHSTEVQALGDDLENRLPGTTWMAESTDWQMRAVMVGGYGSFPLLGQWSLDVKSMIGLLLSDTPQLTLTGEGPTGALGSAQSSSSASSLAYLFGMGFKVGVGSRLYLSLHADYLGSAPYFEGIEVTSSDGTRVRGSFSQNMGVLQVGVGLSYRFAGI